MRPYDVILIHPPSVFDFRERPIFFGPISDVIPSTPIFEMYPVGFMTLAAHLRAAGLRVRIINLAVLMMRRPKMDVPRFLGRLRARLIGIDLHWLPHVDGSLRVAEILKEQRPDTPIVMGGLSASHFHEELARHPAVDYVLRGTATEPGLLSLVRALDGQGRVEDVLGLTWEDTGGVRTNGLPLPFPPDAQHYDLAAMVRQVAYRGAFHEMLPFLQWWRHPITAVFTVRGCGHDCVTCGASQEALASFLGAGHPFYRSPEAIAEQVAQIACLTRAPIFLVGDLFDAGEAHAKATIDALGRCGIQNELTFELFAPPPPWFAAYVADRLPHFSVEFSPESHDPEVRARFDKATFSNEEMEAAIASLLATNCRKVDLFYMIGIPGQTYENVMETITYTEGLFRRFDRRLSAFVTPMGPFLDPGSRAFQDPAAFGYRVRATTLAEHRELWRGQDWEQILSFETEWMSRAQIVDATYDAADALNGLKLETGRIAPAVGAAVAGRIDAARALRSRLQASRADPDDDAGRRRLLEDIRAFSDTTLADKQELFPLRHMWRNFRWLQVLRLLVAPYRPAPTKARDAQPGPEGR